VAVSLDGLSPRGATGLPSRSQTTIDSGVRSSVADGAQPVHDLVRAAPEIVVQLHVLGVQLVVHVRAGLVRPVDVLLDPAHSGRRGRDVRVDARGDGRVDGRTQRRPLPGPDHGQRAPGDVGVDLHERGALDQAAGHHDLSHRHVT